MDRQTLSNYGWLVMVTLILAVMLAFATPFGTYVGDGVVSVANGIVGTSNDATAEENISQESVEWAVKTDHGIDYNTFKYYSNLEDAVEAVNNNNYIGASSKLKNNNVVVGISKDGNAPVIRLVRNTKIISEKTITSNLIIDLNNFTLELNEFAISLETNAKVNIVNGKINKMVTNADSVRWAIILIENSLLKMDNVNVSLINTSQQASAIFYVKPNGSQTLELNDCYLNSKGDIGQINGDNTSRIYNIASSNNTANIKLYNTESHVTGAMGYNIYFFKSSMLTIDNCNISFTEMGKVGTSDNWTSYTIAIQTAMAVVNNSNITMNSPYSNSTSAFCISNNNATAKITNSTIKSNTVKDSSDRNFSYALQVRYGAVADVENCNLLVDASCTQTSTVRCQAGGIANIKNCKCITKFDISCKERNDMYYGHSLVSNGTDINQIHISDSYVEGEFCVYTPSNDIFTEENITYNATNRIYFYS